jgi:hypothetical protein
MISERVLAQPRTACIGTLLSSDVCADEIEQRIIQAYVQLVFQAPDEDGLRTITVAQLQAIEVRLTELRQSKADPKIPPFWLEIFSLPDFASIDSYGCFDFDEAELATAVDLVVTVARNSSN